MAPEPHRGDYGDPASRSPHGTRIWRPAPLHLVAPPAAPGEPAPEGRAAHASPARRSLAGLGRRVLGTLAAWRVEVREPALGVEDLEWVWSVLRRSGGNRAGGE